MADGIENKTGNPEPDCDVDKKDANMPLDHIFQIRKLAAHKDCIDGREKKTKGNQNEVANPNISNLIETDRLIESLAYTY